jgi:3'(2'), 5'-bisphosphate nucleotidase
MAQDSEIITQLQTHLPVVCSIGWGATDILRAYYRGEHPSGSLDIQDGSDGPVTAADIAVNHYILDHLKAAFADQDVAYLSEETYKTQPQDEWLNHPWVWIIDPLDGTRDFIDKTGEYAIHLALVHHGRPVLTVVACPEAEVLYYATLGGGAFAQNRQGETRPLHVSSRDRAEDLTLVVSRTHRDQRFNDLLAKLPCQKQLFVGSVGGKIAALVEQRADVYISLSGKSAPKDWDMAAPELILTEAGGQFTHFDGRPLMYAQGDVNQWGGLLASNGTCHEFLCRQAADALAIMDQGS